MTALYFADIIHRKMKECLILIPGVLLIKGRTFFSLKLHPFAATDSRILSSLGKQLKGTKKRGLISICTAGGIEIAAILEGA